MSSARCCRATAIPQTSATPRSSRSISRCRRFASICRQSYDTLRRRCSSQRSQTLPQQMRAAAPADPLRAQAPLANIKPRLRMTTLYFLANSPELSRRRHRATDRSWRSATSRSTATAACDLLPIGHLREERGARARARAERPGGDHRAHAERGAVARPDRRRRDGLHATRIWSGISTTGRRACRRRSRCGSSGSCASSEHKRTLPPMPDD